jgi:hypothetical protein
VLFAHDLQVISVTLSVQLMHSTDASEHEWLFALIQRFMVVSSASSDQVWSDSLKDKKWSRPSR